MKNTKNIISDAQQIFKRAARIGSAIFLGAVCIGAAAQPARLYASEAEKDKASQISEKKDDGAKAQIQSAATNNAISFEKFIEGMRCCGCGKHCLLTALKCPMGEDALKKAKEEYQKVKNKSAEAIAITIQQADISCKLTSILDMVPLCGLAAGGVYMALDRSKGRTDKQ